MENRSAAHREGKDRYSRLGGKLPVLRNEAVMPGYERLNRTAEGGGVTQSLEVEGGTQDADGEVGEVGSFFVELNPADDAVVLHVLRNFGLIDAEVVGESTLDVNFRVGVAAGVMRFAATAAAGKIAEADAKSLARLDVVRSDLVGIGKQENAGAGGGLVELVEAVQAAGEETAQHGLQLGHAGSKRGVAGAAVGGAFRRKLGRWVLGTSLAMALDLLGFSRFLAVRAGMLRLFFGFGGSGISDGFVDCASS